MSRFRPPTPIKAWQTTVGQALYDLMTAEGWHGVDVWRDRADRVAPCIVGAAPTGSCFASGRQYADWNRLGMDGRRIVECAPAADLPATHRPALTLAMGARLQGFPQHWKFSGKKTQVRRQIANAFPPIMAAAVGLAIREALTGQSVDRKAVLDGLRHRPDDRTFDLDANKHRDALVSWLNAIAEETGLPTGVDQGQHVVPEVSDPFDWLNGVLEKDGILLQAEPA